MEIIRLSQLRFKTQKIARWQLVLGIVIVIAILGYLGTRYLAPATFEKLSAGIASFLKPAEKEATPEEEVAQEAPKTEIPVQEEKKYLETAQKGEGITHLARRALKEYLQEKTPDFQITPEQKIYIEDYLAKAKGNGWLKLGENVEFSQSLIQEAIGKAKTLTPEQLQNLTQFSQLVPGL
jgi:hypothetical protein